MRSRKGSKSERLRRLIERMARQEVKQYTICAFTQEEYEEEMSELRPILRPMDRVVLVCWDNGAIIVPDADKGYFE